jgi:hypothetical protein
LCPTNLAALLVGGVTIHKFSTKLKKQSHIDYYLDLHYIFVDEVSMLGEVFYKFLMMILRRRKIILNLSYQGTIPSLNQSMAESQYILIMLILLVCLSLQLADYNKLELTKCRRADDTL